MPTAFDPTPFQVLADALNGSGGFTSGDYLVQYPRESDDKFTRRKAVAWYANALRPACQRFTGYLTKRPPQREVTQPALDPFSIAATGRMTVWMCSGRRS
jgi:hypothetical protein